MLVGAEAIVPLFEAHLPMRVAGGQLALAPREGGSIWIDAEGALRVVLQWIVFETDNSSRIGEIKEQELTLGHFAAYPSTRWVAYLKGNIRAIPAMAAALDGGILSAMPHDFFRYGLVLDDAALDSPEDFFRALSDPARLEQWNQAFVDQYWRELFSACGLGDRVDDIRALRRDSLRLHLSPIEDNSASIGPSDASSTSPSSIVSAPVSRFGGEPDLPPSLPWPEVDGLPLTFVAQINLAELSGDLESSELPKSGLLSFFYLPSSRVGVSGLHTRVHHLSTPALLARRPTPIGVKRLDPHSMGFEQENVFPGVVSPFYEALVAEDTMRAFYQSRGEAYAAGHPLDGLDDALWNIHESDIERPMSRLLGYASAIQGDPYLDVEVSTTREGWQGWEEGSDEAMRKRRNSRRWRLLLQIDAQIETGLLLEQDGGFLYFWIPESALARRDWAAVRGTLQCH